MRFFIALNLCFILVNSIDIKNHNFMHQNQENFQKGKELPPDDVLAFNKSKSIKEVLKDYRGEFTVDAFSEMLTRPDISHLFLSDIRVLTEKIAAEFPEVITLQTIGQSWQDQPLQVIVLDARAMMEKSGVSALVQTTPEEIATREAAKVAKHKKEIEERGYDDADDSLMTQMKEEQTTNVLGTDLIQIESQIRSNLLKHKIGVKQLVQLDSSLESDGVDWMAIVDETTADDVNKAQKDKPKEDETDLPEEAEKGKAAVDLKKTMEDSDKDKKIIESANVENKAAEKFAASMAGASDASEDVETTTNNKLASTIGQALSQQTVVLDKKPVAKTEQDDDSDISKLQSKKEEVKKPEEKKEQKDENEKTEEKKEQKVEDKKAEEKKPQEQKPEEKKEQKQETETENEDEAKSAEKSEEKPKKEEVKVVQPKVVQPKEVKKDSKAVPKTEIKATKLESTGNAIFITGATHARELLSAQVPLFLCLKLLHQGIMQDNEKYKRILATEKFFFLPVINVDGAEVVEKHWLSDHKILNKRKNGNPSLMTTCGEENAGTDLNRNYGVDWEKENEKNHTELCGDYWPGDQAFSEPESRALRDFVGANKQDIKFIINCHTSGNDFIWPFNGREHNDISQRAPGMLAVFQDIAKNAPFPDGVMKGNSYEVIGDRMGGDADDYMLATYGIPSVTAEMGFFGQYIDDWRCQSKGICFEILRDNTRWIEYIMQKLPDIAETVIIH